MSFNNLLSISLLVLLLLGVITLVVPAACAQETVGSMIAGDDSMSIYDVTKYPVVKPGQNLGISFYIGPMFWIDRRAGSEEVQDINGIGKLQEIGIGSAPKPVVDLQKRVFICNIM